MMTSVIGISSNVKVSESPPSDPLVRGPEGVKTYIGGFPINSGMVAIKVLESIKVVSNSSPLKITTELSLK